MSGRMFSYNRPRQLGGNKKTAWWMWLLLALVIAAIIVVIICLILKWRSSKRKEGFEVIKSSDTLDIAPETSYLESYISSALCYNNDPLVQVTSNGYKTE